MDKSIFSVIAIVLLVFVGGALIKVFFINPILEKLEKIANANAMIANAIKPPEVTSGATKKQ